MKSRSPRIKALLSLPAKLALAVSILMSVSGCNNKSLEMPATTRLSVVFNWNDASEAEVDGMTVYFFPTDSESKLWRFDIAGRNGGEIEIPVGHYSVIAVNNDLPGIYFTHLSDYAEMTANPRQLAGDSITQSTGMLYSAVSPHVDIGYNKVSYKAADEILVTDRHTIELMPDSISTIYHIYLDSVAGADRVHSAKACLYGVASYTVLATATNSVETCAVEGTLQLKDGRSDSGAFEGSVTAPGAPRIPDPQFSLKIIITTSHATYSKIFDVTPQIKNYLDAKNVSIHISGFDIPAADPATPPGNEGVNIEVGVDGWQIIEIHY